MRVVKKHRCRGLLWSCLSSLALVLLWLSPPRSPRTVTTVRIHMMATSSSPTNPPTSTSSTPPPPPPIRFPHTKDNALSYELLNAVYAHPNLLRTRPDLLSAFDAAPWLLPPPSPSPTPTPRLLPTPPPLPDLVTMASMRSKHKYGFDNAITVVFWASSMISMMQNCSTCSYSLSFMFLQNELILTTDGSLSHPLPPTPHNNSLFHGCIWSN